MATSKKDVYSWENKVWYNVTSGYFVIVARVITSILTLKILFQYLSQEQLSFYFLLWSMMGYTIFLDFGFGFAIQKEVAQNALKNDQTKLNEMITTAFFLFTIIGVLLLFFFTVVRTPFFHAIHLSEPFSQDIINAYYIFFGSIALAFPANILTSALAGLHRTYIIDWVTIISTLFYIPLLIYATNHQWSFTHIMILALSNTLVPILLPLIWVKKYLPNIKIKFQYFKPRSLMPILSFSIVSYLITCSNVILQRSDQLIISFTLGVQLVAIYEIGSKLWMIFSMFFRALHNYTNTAYAQMFSSGNFEGIKKLILNSTHIGIIAATPVYALMAMYADEIIQFFTGNVIVNPQTYWVTQILILTFYLTTTINQAPLKAFIVCNRERTALYVILVSTISNVFLSVFLAFKIGFIGIALGTMIPTVLTTWFWVLPLAARFIHLSVFDYLEKILSPAIVPILSCVTMLFFLEWLFPVRSQYLIIDLFWHGVLVFGTTLLGNIKPFLAMNKGYHSDVI